MTVDAVAAEVALPLDRPRFTPSDAPILAETTVELDRCEADDSLQFSQHHIDLELLIGHVRRTLGDGACATLAELIARHPLHQGLAELVGYLRLASQADGPLRAEVDEDRRDTVPWRDRGGGEHHATLPAITFLC